MRWPFGGIERDAKTGAGYRDATQDTEYTVAPCDCVGATAAPTVNPVDPTLVTYVDKVAVAAFPAHSTTVGIAGNVDPNVTVIADPVAHEVPVPNVTDPRIIVADGLVPTTGAGGEVPTPAAAAEVTVVVSHGDQAVVAPVAVP